MAVTLKGDGFRVTAYSDEEQRVTQDEITTWEFDVQAVKRGQQRLVMSVSLRIPVPGQPLEHKSIPVREATINVYVGAPALVGHFVAANWQWFIGTAIAIAAVVVAVVSTDFSSRRYRPDGTHVELICTVANPPGVRLPHRTDQKRPGTSAATDVVAVHAAHETGHMC